MAATLENRPTNEQAIGAESDHPHADGPTCPFCDAVDIELVSLFASQLLFSHFRCRACGSYFEAVRDDRWED